MRAPCCLPPCPAWPQALAGLLLGTVLALCAPAARAEEDASWIDRLLNRLGASKEVDLSHGIDWGVLPGPFFNPEMGLGIGMAAVGLYKPSNALTGTQISTLNVRGFATTTGAVGIGFDNTTFFTDDSYRFAVTGGLVNMPTSYWGVGYDRAINDANKERYTKREIFLQPKMLWRVHPNTYVGAGVNLQYDDAAKLARGSASALATDPSGTHVFSSGVSAHFSYDTRDFLPNPYSGQALMANATLFRRALGSDNDFETLEWSYDSYHRMRERDVLAFDIYGRFGWGNVPWNMLSQLGDNRRMRGYFLGQYRDKDSLSAQVEYRLHIAGRQGMVFWAGTGAIAPSVGKLTSAHWLPNAGIGYRFEFKPRVNVRLDAGFGRQTRGVYFQINEAF
ncbi:BamA/TamA family outer membrane protein [Cupriavidus basilensis]|uniref:BamA/TamA family outer membrane protein n=1 Tax=Cupriavidus basilensis TaxID=68895 RepID=A0A643FT16_9BURK|nr:BamA/TamA family outer membrane protein [Cupriavidus basilensis]QOT80622.1 BamA/TamA family outer membrane protein [Cupriavidus basilensis]